jgi:tRNA threonylcarbamoyladenosine biosynthesis protein TsaB
MLLAIDTSTAQIGLALYDGSQVIGELFWHSRLHHSQELAPALAGLLARTDVAMKQIQALGVAIGPGSFTSLRVGLAFVKGLSLACHLPLIGIPTLDIVAAAIPLPSPATDTDRPARLAAVLQAGRGRLALGWYRATEACWQSEGSASITTAGELVERIRQRTIVCGELNAEERSRLSRKYRNVSLASPAQCVRRPALLAELAWMCWQEGKVDAAASLAPTYLHVAGGPPG